MIEKTDKKRKREEEKEERKKERRREKVPWKQSVVQYLFPDSNY